MTKVPYFNIALDVVNTDEALSLYKIYLNSVPNNLMFFLNAHYFNIAQKNPEYRNSLNSADLLLNDGIGIKIGAKLWGIRLKENMNGTDFIPKLLQLANELHKNVYFLGGKEGIAQLAKQNVEQKYPGINIVGARNGYFDYDNDQDVIDEIVSKKTDILLVGMGAPRQELWLTKNKNKLKGVNISVAGGGIFDFKSNRVPRAPLWMRKIGTEWVFRWAQEPIRLFNRYAIGIPLFFYYILKFTLSFEKNISLSNLGAKR
jgi:N-acetylglucosaminyldiphosphoundecaprenol N-acetyl-beta-D-mannosaminyltransferase